MNVENLENNLISFELTDEDVQAIRGGSTEEATVYGAYRCHFSFPITCVVGIYVPQGNPKPGFPKTVIPISGTPSHPVVTNPSLAS